MNIKSILDMPIEDVMKLSKKDLTKATSTLASAANKRYRTLNRLHKNESVYSPARDSLTKSGGAISVKNKNLNEVRREFVRAKNFLESSTSTGRGAKRFMKEMEFNLYLTEQGKVTEYKRGTEKREKAFKRYRRRMSNDDLTSFFQNYNKLQEYKGVASAWGQLSSSEVMRTLYETTKQNEGKSVEDILAEAADRLQKESDRAYNEMRVERDADKSADVFTSEGWL